jgi:hypothetical protein
MRSSSLKTSRWLILLFLVLVSILTLFYPFHILLLSSQKKGKSLNSQVTGVTQDQNHEIPCTQLSGDPSDEESSVRDRRTRNDLLTDTIDFGFKPPIPHLSKRAVTPQQWSQYVCKGERLRSLMAMTIEKATASLNFQSESAFQDYDNLDKSGQYDFTKHRTCFQKLRNRSLEWKYTQARGEE